MTFRTLIVGLGHAGLQLHWRTLQGLRKSLPDLMAQSPAVVWDVRDVRELGRLNGLETVASLSEARTQLEPTGTVVHLCTPPTNRLSTLTRLAELGFRQIVVEKPLALDATELAGIDDLRTVHALKITVVSHWLDAELTARLRGLVTSARLGQLRSIDVVQSKPRFIRTIESNDVTTAFDIEPPHSIGVALRLAGDGHVRAARWTDLRLGGVVVSHMGAAHLELDHGGGIRTRITSDLTSPVRERRITLAFERGQAIGHFAGSRDGDCSQLAIAGIAGDRSLDIFPDDALSAFVERAYRRFANGDDDSADYALNRRVTQLVSQAKDVAASTERSDTDAHPRPVVGYAS